MEDELLSVIKMGLTVWLNHLRSLSLEMFFTLAVVARKLPSLNSSQGNSP